MKIMVTEAGKRAYSWGSVLNRRAPWLATDLNTRMWATMWVAHHMEMDNVEFSGVKDISHEEGATELAGLMNLYIANSPIASKPAGIVVDASSVMMCRREEIIRCVLTREDVVKPDPNKIDLVCKECGSSVKAEYKIDGAAYTIYDAEGAVEKEETEYDEHAYMGLYCTKDEDHQHGLMLNEDGELVVEPEPVFFLRLTDPGKAVLDLLETLGHSDGNTELGKQVKALLMIAKETSTIPWLQTKPPDLLTAHKAALHAWRTKYVAWNTKIPTPNPWDLNVMKRALEAGWVDFLPVAH